MGWRGWKKRKAVSWHLCRKMNINMHHCIILWERARHCRHCCGWAALEFSLLTLVLFVDGIYFFKKSTWGLGEGLVTLLLMLRGSHFGQESEKICTCCSTATELRLLRAWLQGENMSEAQHQNPQHIVRELILQKNTQLCGFCFDVGHMN